MYGIHLGRLNKYKRGRKMSKKLSAEERAKAAKKKAVIDDWLERKAYEIPYESFIKIRYSLVQEEPKGLTQRELFIRSLARYYKKNFGKWPVIFRV